MYRRDLRAAAADDLLAAMATADVAVEARPEPGGDRLAVARVREDRVGLWLLGPDDAGQSAGAGRPDGAGRRLLGRDAVPCRTPNSTGSGSTGTPGATPSPTSPRRATVPRFGRWTRRRARPTGWSPPPPATTRGSARTARRSHSSRTDRRPARSRLRAPTAGGSRP